MEQTRGERVHELRKSLDLTLEKFGARLGVQKSTMSRIENGAGGLTDSMAKLICQTYHVSEAWLLDGVGEMFAEVPDALLGELYRRYDCSETSQWIIEEFLKLGPEEQDVIYQYIRNVYLRSVSDAADPDTAADSNTIRSTDPDAAPHTGQSSDQTSPPADRDGPSASEIDRRVADYRERLELEARREDTSGASSQGPATA